ncbi:exostosin-like glycosyltransferase [Haematococcus lacustris]
MAGFRRLVLCIAVAVLNACRLGTTAYGLEAIAKRCESTIGDWCGRFDRQKWLITRPVPRGRQPCPSTKHGVCSGVGNCNYDTGLCDCPAGLEAMQQPPTPQAGVGGSLHHKASLHPEQVGHIDEEGRDLDPLADGFTESRCIGICDATIAACYCDGPRFGRVNPPKGSPPATPPLRRGRPLGNHLCQPSDDGKGNALPWGQVPWDDLYGPEGWCMANDPKFTCPCMYDGLDGQLCDKVIEMYCPNSCSGHGVCDLGFCKCNQGWYGADCVRKNADMDMFEVRAWESLQARVHGQLGAVHASIAQRATEHLVKAHRLRRMRPHTRATAPMVAYGKEEAEVDPAESDSTTGLADGAEGGASGAMSGPEGPHHLLLTHRPRPLIYVYDLPAAYNARMLQYRVDKMQCVWRAYGSGNTTLLANTLYGLEPLLHELMLQSEHRTFDPEEADYFYMPIYSSCFIYPIHCWADGPWWHSPSGPRVMHVANMLLEARDWVRSHFPWWNRRGGRDHIFLMTHDEGACYAPIEIFNSSIFLTHWGRLDLHHRSNTAFTPDNYTQEYVYSNQPNGWLKTIQGHPCYDPVKASAAAIRGDMGKHRLPWYSRGIRQRLYALAQQQQWAAKHAIFIGEPNDIPGDYSQLLAQSRFCLVAPGDGWSSRAEDAVLHGCIPLVVMDQVHVVFEPLLDWAAFSVRVAEDQLDKLPQILAGISLQQQATMRRALRQVWHRFAWTRHPLLQQDVHKLLQAGLAQQLSRLPKAEAQQGTEAGSGAEAGKVGLGRSLHAGGGSREGSLQSSVDGVRGGGWELGHVSAAYCVPDGERQAWRAWP